jgi:hypothetical protein
LALDTERRYNLRKPEEYGIPGIGSARQRFYESSVAGCADGKNKGISDGMAYIKQEPPPGTITGKVLNSPAATCTEAALFNRARILGIGDDVTMQTLVSLKRSFIK